MLRRREDRGSQDHLAEGTSEGPADIPVDPAAQKGRVRARPLSAGARSSRSTTAQQPGHGRVFQPIGQGATTLRARNWTGAAVTGTQHTASEALPQTAGSGAWTLPGVRAGALVLPRGWGDSCVGLCAPLRRKGSAR